MAVLVAAVLAGCSGAGGGGMAKPDLAIVGDWVRYHESGILDVRLTLREDGSFRYWYFVLFTDDEGTAHRADVEIIGKWEPAPGAIRVTEQTRVSVKDSRRAGELVYPEVVTDEATVMYEVMDTGEATFTYYLKGLRIRVADSSYWNVWVFSTQADGDHGPLSIVLQRGEAE